MRNRYRIVRDRYRGYNAQVKFWWFPFMWVQITGNDHSCNTYPTKERAEALIRLHANPVVREVVP